MPIDRNTLATLLPEILLVIVAVLIYVGGTLSRSRSVWSTLGVLAFAGATAWLVRYGYRPEMVGTDAGQVTRMTGPLLLDVLAYGLRCAAAVLGLLFCLFATQSRQDRLYPELLGSLVLVFAGLMLVCGAGDLVLMFVGFELISIPTYVLLFIGRAGRDADEATAKYFYLSILSSALLLYGLAALYGLAGDTQLTTIHTQLPWSAVPSLPMLPLALTLIVAGLGFKLAAVPFHFYAPDVYEATTHLNAALLATVPKIAAAVGIIRILVTALPRDSAFAWQMLIVVSVASMTLGNVAALWQQNVRRLLAYSSIAHAGYLLLGLAAAMGSPIGTDRATAATAAVVFYVLVYAAATLGAFASLGYLSRDDRAFSKVSELSGVGRRHPVIGGCLAICMFSLSGIPPLAGFWGKFALFKSALDVGLAAEQHAVNPWFLTLCVLGVLNAAIAAAYYLRVVATIYFAPAEERQAVTPVMGHRGAGVVALASALMIVGIGLFTGRFLSQAQSAARSAWYGAEVRSPAAAPVPLLQSPVAVWSSAGPTARNTTN